MTGLNNQFSSGLGRSDSMNRLQIWWVLLVVLSVCLPGRADEASSAFKKGLQAEGANKFDEAFQEYNKAHTLKPRDAKYFTAYTRVRFYAALEHIKAGQVLRDSGKLQEAVVEFQKAAEIDHTNFVAKEEVRRTEDMIRKQAQKKEETPKKPSQLDLMAEQMEGPIELTPISNTLINLRLSETSTMVYKTIAKLAGINVLFDQDYKPTKITIELNDVTLREALNVVALQTKTFWQPTSSNTILVAADTATKRKEMTDTVMKTFYLKNVSTASDLQEAANTLKGILDLSRMQLIPNQNAIILRGTPDQMVLAQKLLTDIDKPKPEVVIDIAVLQVSRDRIRTLGINPPTSASVSLVPSANGTSGGASSTGGFTVNSLQALNATNIAVSIPGASMSLLMSDSDTKLIQNPEIRVLDNEKATLKIGDRVPVATGSFGAAAGGGGVSALVNTQFQYLDVGVNIDITPHIHSENEVTLKMTLEVSSVSGTQNIGGISQPVIGQRRIEHETRLQDGEVNLVGGILEDTETHSLAGYPWLTKIPILKYLFGQEDRERQENEIVFAIMPHIVRAQTLTDDNLRLVDLGPGTGVTVRYKDPRKDKAAAGSTEQTQSKPHVPEQHAATPVPVAPAQKAAEPPKNPAVAVPPTATTSSLVAPSRIPPQNTTTRPPDQRPAPPPPNAAQSSADPCPYGQHSIGQENGVVTCAFN
jgi:general secretion pathway protein D